MPHRPDPRRDALRELSLVDVATPCHARWEEMDGDEKVRFCGACRLHVYNLSAMDVEEAAARISCDEERLCLRFYRRSDGTILTRDCPVGSDAAAGERRLPARGIAGMLAGVGLAGALLSPVPMMGARARPNARLIRLQYAAHTGDLAGIRSMLDAGVDPDGGGRRPTPLMLAAVAGQVQAVKLLLARGANPAARDSQGKTALEWAEAAPHSRIVALLKRAGAAK